MATTDKYDRQIRLWGAHGQRCLSSCNVLLINGEASGTEALKNLILPGIKSFTIVDPANVTERDLGNNFFVTKDSLGHSRAQVVSETLAELNPDVTGHYDISDFASYIAQNKDNIGQNFQLIIAVDVTNTIALQLGDLADKYLLPLILIRQYGQIFLIRNFKKEVCVIESKPADVDTSDLRISRPFKEILDYARSIDFASLEDNIHSHIPYVIILIKALDQFRAQNQGGELPKTEQEKQAFREMVKGMARDSKELNFEEAYQNVFKCFQNPSLLKGELEDIFNDPNINSPGNDFWFLCAALKRFYEQRQELPLQGSLPDMVSTTDFFIQLQKIYQAKAQEDIELFMQILVHIYGEVKGNLEGFADSFPDSKVKLFCQNASLLQVTKIRSIKEELSSLNYEDIGVELFDEESLINWYLISQGLEMFRDQNNGHYPQNHEQINAFRFILNQIQDQVRQNCDNPEYVIPEKCVNEILRFGDSKLHSISSFIGGVASQESIKMLISQYTIMNNTYIGDGISGKGQIFMA